MQGGEPGNIIQERRIRGGNPPDRGGSENKRPQAQTGEKKGIFGKRKLRILQFLGNVRGGLADYEKRGKEGTGSTAKMIQYGSLLNIPKGHAPLRI